jgi:glycine/D-amino acid oxidase-like deaminating enzyme
MSKSVVIVGAGIIGISTAYKLAEINPYADLTIISKDFPESGLLSPYYTSSKAGAHFRPFPSNNEFEYRDSKFTHSTYRKFKELAVEHPETSIKFITGIDYLETENSLYENLGKGYIEIVDDFIVIPKDALPKTVKFGAKYKTFAVNPHDYMMFMLNSLKLRQNIKLIQKEVYSLSQVSELFPDKIIVNCTGNGLLFDGSHDVNCFSIRGQTLLVRPPLSQLEKFENQTITYQLANGQWCFCIPRPLNGGIIIGGSKNLKSYKDTPDELETNDLILNASKHFPELFDLKTGKLDIIRVNVGFRPARRGGVRLEREVVNNGKKTIIVHCYGFGGSGIEMSWGAVEKVAELVLLSDHFKL